MISLVTHVPENVIAFRATGTVSAADFKDILIPAVAQHVKEHEELNYVLLIDTELTDFTIGSWIQNLTLGIEQLKHWRKAAIICDLKSVKVFTDIIFKVMPGEFKVFEHSHYQQALAWASS